ncbi:MAG: glycosyltransferase family 4 protein [Candidatus Limivivens sp.]|nr:glycosyltransferase family 4 protein [Candidatus Limivivens sp.]
MKVLLYTGGKRLVGESGIGQALVHQKRALTLGGVEFTEDVSEDYDLVHINTVLPDARSMAVRAKKAGKKVVYHGHSTMEDFRNSFAGSNLTAPLFKKWLCACYEEGDLVLTPTEYSRKLLVSYGLRTPVVPVSNGIDTEFFKKEPGQRQRFREKYGFGDREKIVLSVGLPIERKGILDVISLAGQLPQYQFFWCGHAAAGLLPSHVRRAMAKAPKNLHFPGYLNREELRDAYGGCDLFLFPTQEETEGIVMLEALAMEIPVLVRDIPVYEGWLENGVQVWKERVRPGFANRLREILEGELPDLTKEGRAAAEERDLKIIGSRLAAIYHALVSGTRRQ